MIQVQQLHRYFGKVHAVQGISFEIAPGEIFGFLGPNGAGKSTTIKILVTLLRANSGKIQINGYDVIKNQAQVRKSVGIIFQDPSLDERLTGYENLYFHAKIYHIPSKHVKQKVEQALSIVGLGDRKHDLVMKYSGGMKRRLEIARGIMHMPKVLFLDEPTIGLDPQTRKHIWEYLKQLKEEHQLTIFLTTHYIEEAEICDRIAIMDQGRIVTLDSPEHLKNSIGKETIMVTYNEFQPIFNLVESIKNDDPMITDQKSITFRANDTVAALAILFEKGSRWITDISIKKPTLEDVFIQQTGRAIREEDASSIDQLRSSVKMRHKK